MAWDTIIGTIMTLVGVVGIGYVVLTWYGDRQFEKRYAEFKRQQRENRRRFFEELNKS